MYMPEIGERIKQLRMQRGISQVQLAQHLGISKSVVSSYENAVHFPPYDILLKMAWLFGVSTDYILGAAGNRALNVDGLTDVQIERGTHEELIAQRGRSEERRVGKEC